jgi:hypothetical protein
MKIPLIDKPGLTSGVINHSYNQIYVVNPNTIDETLKEEMISEEEKRVIRDSLIGHGFAVHEFHPSDLGDTHEDLWVMNNPDNVWLIVQLTAANYDIQNNILPSRTDQP